MAFIKSSFKVKALFSWRFKKWGTVSYGSLYPSCSNSFRSLSILIWLISVKNNLKGSGVESLGAEFFNYIKNNSNLFFPERLMLSLKAGLTAGGEEGSIHSAGIKVADDTAWPLIDLRIDWSDNDPIEELYKLWKAYEPQMNDYKSRALDPTKAPSYGVPGDL